MRAKKKSDGGPSAPPETPLRPAVSRPTPEEFGQLTLDATVIGPGSRTEDPYEPGTWLRVEGERGVFTYRYASVSQAGLVSLHLMQDGMFRAVRPDQVSLVKKSRGKK